MIDQIRTYITIIAFTALAVAFGLTKWELHNVNKEYSSYKENINDQLQAAINEKKRIEAEQSAKLAKAKLDYSNTRRDLDYILDRLRNGEIVPRDESMPLAGSSADSLPRKAEDTTGTIDPIDASAGIRSTAFYTLSMRDTLQCSRLIEFVSK